MTGTPTSSTVETRIVVRGAVEPQSIWPEERPLAALVADRWAAEIGDPEKVLALLAQIEGADEAAYRAAHGADVASIRDLSAHCAAAVLHAAVRIDGDLSPAAVLAALHGDLRPRGDRRPELLDLLAS
ncbi:MAG TPA: hypothetical protein VJ804_04870 [Acidimicrobiales bacterium]|nr:hypothetical protein [Acidimicrobiales bacterium]